MSFTKISKRSNAFDIFRDPSKDLARLIPEPDQAIVNRLISYYGGTNYSIRLPWAPTPQQPSYDLENVRFYAS